MIVMTTEWRLLSSHGQVLFYLAKHADATIAQITDAVELSERRVSIILRDLQRTGMLRITRIGRRNTYQVNGDATFRHPSLSEVQLADILSYFTASETRCA